MILETGLSADVLEKIRRIFAQIENTDLHDHIRRVGVVVYERYPGHD